MTLNYLHHEYNIFYQKEKASGEPHHAKVDAAVDFSFIHDMCKDLFVRIQQHLKTKPQINRI